MGDEHNDWRKIYFPYLIFILININFKIYVSHTSKSGSLRDTHTPI
jgi:hypothetical protein